MKKLLTLAIFLVSANAFAQTTSIINDTSGNTDVSSGKVKNIKTITDGSLKAIETTAKGWDNEITTANTTLSETATEVHQVITELNDRQDTFFEDEKDEGATFPTYATKPVPICAGSTPRLAYSNNSWRCLAPIDCGAVNSGQSNWEQRNDGKCVRAQSSWSVGAWSSCGTSQTRSVTCVKEGTTQNLGDNQCAGPKPATSRTCVG
jgi:hypothetical protein